MVPQTFIFIGRSGCGKGTQAKLLIEKVKALDPVRPLYHLETGQRFREFIAQKGYTNDLARKIMEEGRRQPDFLAVWMWSHHFVEGLTEDMHLLVDGTPRSLNEAKILDNAMEFYHRDRPKVVHLKVSRTWSEKHLLARGRADDVHDDIKQRLNWYERDVEPAVEYYRTNADYDFIEINGEQSIDAVQQEMIEKIIYDNNQNPKRY
jgi:adenylate kinase